MCDRSRSDACGLECAIIEASYSVVPSWTGKIAAILRMVCLIHECSSCYASSRSGNGPDGQRTETSVEVQDESQRLEGAGRGLSAATYNRENQLISSLPLLRLAHRYLLILPSPNPSPSPPRPSSTSAPYHTPLTQIPPPSKLTPKLPLKSICNTSLSIFPFQTTATYLHLLSVSRLPGPSPQQS